LNLDLFSLTARRWLSPLASQPDHAPQSHVLIEHSCPMQFYTSLQVALKDGSASLVVAIDISGDDMSLHPLDKFNLARRVAAAVVGRFTRPTPVASGPTFQQVIC